jgi:hypothetical protein
MPKTVPPNQFTLPTTGEAFIANAIPDAFDARDLEYRPGLAPLPPTLDQRRLQARQVLTQQGNSCTGHALASMINTVLAQSPGRNAAGKSPLVSPYMLYRLARRYDEFEGEEDAGSSLRGAFKGWFHHGVALADEWPDLDSDPDVDEPEFSKRCRERPLGAFYRVNPYRLDDMQSAIRDLHAICVSAQIHQEWLTPTLRHCGGREAYVIARKVDSELIGGHAFALVGYNEIGFLVQNSWGRSWGKDGFATLPYDDWLDSAYDAWVARPGVPHTPFTSGRTRTAVGSNSTLVTAPAPDLRRLSRYVVNLGNDGRLSTNGRFQSSPAQIERAFKHLETWHDCWQQTNPGEKRRIVLFAHGGLVSEADGLTIAENQLNSWLNNRIYPLSFAWQSGPIESLANDLGDFLHMKLPFGAMGFDLTEQTDKLAEKLAGPLFRGMWAEMKENARLASKPIGNATVAWPPAGAAETVMKGLPGASLTVTRLAQYFKKHAGNVEVHLVGHSAGSIFLGAMLPRLREAGIPVTTLTFLAPAIRSDEFARDVLPHLQDHSVRRFAIFTMTNQRELNDSLATKGIKPYHKSLLYFVARALERAAPGDRGEVPILGLAKFWTVPLPGGTTPLNQLMAAVNGELLTSPAATTTQDDQQSNVFTHGDFDNDPATMNSVVLRVRGLRQSSQVVAFMKRAPLNVVPGSPADEFTDVGVAAAVAPQPAKAASLNRAFAAEPGMPVAAEPETQPAEVEGAPPQTAQPVAPGNAEEKAAEVSVAPVSGSPILDVLQQYGWE